jgi:serine/threonine-protein kinase
LKSGDEIKAGHTVLRLSIAEIAAHGSGTDAAVRPPQQLQPVRETTVSGANEPEGSEHPASANSVCFAGYRLLRELGRGGMGIVYLAERIADGSQVAVKTVTAAVSGSRKQVERFLRESKILRQLDHPHIVAFREMGEADGRLFFAMDYVPGTDASQLLKLHGPLPIRTAARMVCQLLQALEYAHAKGFVHRDIKPSNLLVADEDGKKTVKLADFGLARAYQESQLSGLTIMNEMGGTLAFMAPEQIVSFREAKPPVDQYAAAATLYNLLTGEHIFDRPANVQGLLAMILQQAPVAIQSRRQETPAELAAIIHRALAKVPGKRFADVREFRQALLPYAK